jgi:FAD/FMN-containing dehydrogenase
MSELKINKLNGGIAVITPEALTALRAALGGQAFLPGEPGYDLSRTVWNATVDKRPGLVARCAGTSDVIQAMRFARQHELLVAVRSGGHNIAGKAVADGAFLIDLSQMRSVRVDRAAKVAWVEPGATLADFDRETQAFGLTAPVGINSTTGIAGLTLGGGFGWTTRKLGLSIDSLMSADVITANGQLCRASEKENADLFWRFAVVAAISE